MPYLRKTGTFIVRTETGETVFVDEFEGADPSRSARAAASDRKQMMLRDGKSVTRLGDGTLLCADTGEQLVIISRE